MENKTPADTKDHRPFLLRWRERLLKLTLLMLAGSWIAYFLARNFWAAEILTHFRAQYLFIGLIGIALGTICRKPLFTISLLLLTIPHAVHIGNYYVDNTQDFKLHGTPLKILSINVLQQNSQHDETLDFIQDFDPDILIVVEFSEPWVKALKSRLSERFPYSTYSSGRIWHGNYVFSKQPLKLATTRPEYQQDKAWEMVGGAILNWDGQDILIIPAHPASPVSPQRLIYRTWAMGMYRKMAEASKIPFIFAGDFNCSSGSPYFHDLVDEKLVFDSRKGFGWQGSWPEFFTPAMIPIDHILTSKHWAVSKRKVHSATGSDHFPISATLQLKKLPANLSYQELNLLLSMSELPD